jgi:hypothetical protein
MNYNEYAKQELGKIGFTDTEIERSILMLLQSISSLHNEPSVIKGFLHMIERIVEKKPLSPLLEEELLEDDNGNIYHPRYNHIQKIDNYYVDTRAIAFINNKGHKWYGANGIWRSSKQITFPYYPEEQVIFTGEE